MAERLPGLLAAAMVVSVAVLYLAIIFGEPDPNDMTVVTGFAGALFLGAAAALAGALARDPYWRRLFFGIAAVVTFVCAWLSGFSIGPLLIPAVLMLSFAFARG